LKALIGVAGMADTFLCFLIKITSYGVSSLGKEAATDVATFHDKSLQSLHALAGRLVVMISLIAGRYRRRRGRRRELNYRDLLRR